MRCIIGLADYLWGRITDTFTKSRESRGDFFMGSLRPIIDEVDEFVGNLYGLTDDEIAYTKAYLTHLGENSGRAGAGDADVTDYEAASADD